MCLIKLPWQTFSNLIIVCCYDNESTILNIDTACNKLKCKMANSIFHNYLPIILFGQKKDLFCSTLSEFENFLLCERILINLTTCQNETSS
jgi:hypothetical protein